MQPGAFFKNGESLKALFDLGVLCEIKTYQIHIRSNQKKTDPTLDNTGSGQSEM
jgi:hypothetical protein